jgi:hypothetical protein
MSMRMIAELRLTTAQQRATGQNLPFVLYVYFAAEGWSSCTQTNRVYYGKYACVFIHIKPYLQVLQPSVPDRVAVIPSNALKVFYVDVSAQRSRVCKLLVQRSTLRFGNYAHNPYKKLLY